MSEDVSPKPDRILRSIQQLGLYKLLFSQKAAFCFILLITAIAIVIFSSWAVCKHIIDSSTYGTIIMTFGGIAATLAGIYNVVHGMNDRYYQGTCWQQNNQLNPLPPNSNLPPNGTI